jgi:hypothetical protein
MEFAAQKRLSLGLIQWGYELEACAACAVELEAHPDGSVVGNACLEAHLVHARALIEFLLETKRRPYDDDMLRTDFAPEWVPSPSDEVARVMARKESINKHLAHLTWRRVEDVEPIDWTYQQMAQDVVAIAQAWADHVNDSDPTIGSLALSHVQTARRALGDDGRDAELLVYRTN